MIDKKGLIEKMIAHLESLQGEDLKAMRAEKMPEKYGKKPVVEVEAVEDPDAIEVEKVDIESSPADEILKEDEELKEGEMSDDELKEMLKKFMA